ncbi:MAG: hypothetical protein ACKVZ6_06875 [Kineosporiaceae bacterium]
MYLRTTTRRTSDGSVVRYVQLAHNRRVNGVTQAHVLVNLGREEHLDVEGLRRLVGSIRRWLGDDVAQVPAQGRPTSLEALRVLDVRPVGSVWLLDGLWRAVGVDAALREGIDPRRWTPDVERVAFAAVAVRAVEPSAVGAVGDWVSRCAAVPGLEAMTPGEVSAVIELVATADLDLRLRGEPLLYATPPRMIEPLRSAGDRRRFGEAVLTWLAAVLVRFVEVRTGLPWSVVRGDLDRIAAVTLAGPQGSLVTVTEPTPSQSDVYAVCGVGAPPRVLAAAVA